MIPYWGEVEPSQGIGQRLWRRLRFLEKQAGGRLWSELPPRLRHLLNRHRLRCLRLTGFVSPQPATFWWSMTMIATSTY